MRALSAVTPEPPETGVREEKRPAPEEQSSAVQDLRVCHLIGSLKYGGAERQVVNLLNHLPVSKRFIMLLERSSESGLGDALDPEITWETVPLRLRRLPLDILRVARLLRRWRIDILHTHMFWANLVGAVAARLAGVRVVVTSEHGKNEWKRFHHRWLERVVISPLVDLRLCASEDILCLRRDRDGIPADRLAYIPNGTLVPPVVEQRERRVPVIGTVGRLVPAKDYPGLIAAAAGLRDAGVPFRLCIVGDGPERSCIQAVIESHALEAQVELLGARNDVSACLRSFDIFVMSSIREGQPLALLEAMAHGLPVVATRVGGIPGTLAHGEEGLLVEAGDCLSLQQALTSLITDPARRRTLGENARRRVERDFSINAVTDRVASTYMALWEANHAPAS